MFIVTEASIQRLLSEVVNKPTTEYDTSANALSTRMVDTRNIVRARGEHAISNWADWYIYTGRMILAHLHDRLKGSPPNEAATFDVNKFTRMLNSKHQKYTAEPLMGWQNTGVLMRLDSKAARLKNLAKGTIAPSEDESYMDTLQDMLGYCVLGMAMDALSDNGQVVPPGSEPSV